MFGATYFGPAYFGRPYFGPEGEAPAQILPGYSVDDRSRWRISRRDLHRKAEEALEALYDDEPRQAAALAVDASQIALAEAAAERSEGHAGEAARLLQVSRALTDAARKALQADDGATRVAAYLAMNEAARKAAATEIDHDEEAIALLSMIL